MTEPILPSLQPISIKERLSVLFVERGQIEVIDGAFVVVDKDGVRTHVPVGGVFVPTIYQQILLDTTGQQKPASIYWSGLSGLYRTLLNCDLAEQALEFNSQYIVIIYKY